MAKPQEVTGANMSSTNLRALRDADLAEPVPIAAGSCLTLVDHDTGEPVRLFMSAGRLYLQPTHEGEPAPWAYLLQPAGKIDLLNGLPWPD